RRARHQPRVHVEPVVERRLGRGRDGLPARRGTPGRFHPHRRRGQRPHRPRVRVEPGLGHRHRHPGRGMTTATITTSMGPFTVRLLPEHAPVTVKNFVDLATGGREWTDPRDRRRTTAPLYSGTIFHRVIPDFMIQGGDPEGSGRGGPGYT